MIAERILSIGIVLFATFFFFMSFMLESGSNVQIGPGAWPLFLTVMMFILGMILIYRNFWKKKHIELEDSDEVQIESELVYPRNLIYLFMTLIIYVAVLDYLGFIVATLLVVVAATALFGMRNWLGRVITSIMATAGFVVLFPILLQSPFPRGQGIFRTISLLFY